MATSRNDNTATSAASVAHDAATSVLAIGALGVVYGDIGTNPLFAMREAFTARHHVGLDESNIYGLLSLMFWSLILVVTIKYLTTVMRADNDGEGGILALAALVSGKGDATSGRRWILVLVGILGAALLYGDGMVTPAISVLAAVEGTAVATPSFEHYVVPIACVILIGLFVVQRKGTALIGRVFGPMMIIWFVHHRSARREPAPATTRRAAGDVAQLRRAVLHRQRLEGLPRTGRRHPGRGRRRGAVRRHGPLRATTDTARMVRPGAAQPDPGVLRPGGAVDPRPGRDRQPVLPDGTARVCCTHLSCWRRWPRSSPRKR